MNKPKKPSKPKKLPITLCTITRNAGPRLEKLVKHCRGYVSEVILFDQSSTDGTWKKAQKLADVAVQRRHKGTADPDRNLIFELGKNPWVLYLDDDEYLDDGLVKALPELLADEHVDVYWIKTINLVDGVNINEIFGKGEDPHPRIFRKGSIDFPDEIHTYPKAAEGVKAAYLNHYMVHDRDYKKLVASNRARDRIASPEQIQVQENFISKVKELLDKKKEAVPGGAA